MNEEFSRFKSRSSIEAKVKTNDRFSQVFNVVLNYWEIKPTQYEAKLHELALKNVKIVSAFVPWAHLETDIFHSLKKFARAAWSVKLSVRLFVMPELGVNYPNAGFPKDLLANIGNLAVDRIGRVIYNHAAPNIFSMPSFSSPEVLKRFGNYLIKLGSILAEVFAEAGTSDFCEIVVSNTLFNYYRSHGLGLADHGDYSAAQVMAFRDFLDCEYRVNPAAAHATQGQDNETPETVLSLSEQSGEQFKMQLYEGYNRHRFFTHIEKLLREKTDMVFARKSTACKVRHIDLFNPECASEAAYHGLLSELFDSKPSLERYYRSIIAGGYRGEAIFLGDSGVFRRFNEQEKSFLLLAALIHSGEVCTMVEDLFRLSPNFHRKLRALVTFLEERRLVRQRGVTYVSASKFSMEETSFAMFSKMAPGVISAVPGLEHHTKHFSERLVFLDPKAVVRLIEFVQLLALAQSGKVVAIPAPMRLVPNYSADASTYYEKFKKGRRAMQLNIGVPYEVYEYHLGHVVFYEPQIFWTPGEKPGLTLFFQALLGLSDIHSMCSSSDPRLHVTSYVSEEDPSLRLLFITNPTSETVNTRLAFGKVVTLTGLPNGGLRDDALAPLVGRNFELAVPPLGILSMQLSDPDQEELRGLAADADALVTGQQAQRLTMQAETGGLGLGHGHGVPENGGMTRWT